MKIVPIKDWRNTPNLQLVIDNTRRKIGNMGDVAISKTLWMFPEGEIGYSVLSKIFISLLAALTLIVSVYTYQYVAIAWWLNIMGIGAATEWLLNIGPRIDRKYETKANYYTFAGALTIYASFQAISGIIHKIGWEWTIFIAGVCYLPDAGSYLAGNLVIKPLKRLAEIKISLLKKEGLKPWKARLIKLIPEIKTHQISKASPKKTWEALLFGGLPASLCVGIKFIYPEMPAGFLSLYGAITVSFIGVFLGASGDMFESWIKRLIGIKDSSILLGPMGGFVDRIDSFLATSIIFIVIFYLL